MSLVMSLVINVYFSNGLSLILRRIPKQKQCFSAESPLTGLTGGYEFFVFLILLFIGILTDKTV